MRIENNVRQRILDAALDLVEEHGIAALTQPKVAKAAGLRQSHLTYYFPRKADLCVALLDASHTRAATLAKRRSATQDEPAWDEHLTALVCDRRRMQFFLGIVLAASEAAELRPIVAEHLRALSLRLADTFGRAADDPAITAFVDQLRGLGFRMLLEPEATQPDGADVRRLAANLGLISK